MRAAIIGLAFISRPARLAFRRKEAPVVVELFTSQGCSSCPPADAFLTELAHQRRDVLPLAFHVTDWDYSRLGRPPIHWTPPVTARASVSMPAIWASRAEGLSAIAGATHKQVPVSVARDAGSLLIWSALGLEKPRCCWSASIRHMNSGRPRRKQQDIRCWSPTLSVQ